MNPVLNGVPISVMLPYQRVKYDLRRKILDGDLKAGDRLPNEFDLAGQYHVSRLTVNRAVGDLVRENYLLRQRGIGTFVKNRDSEPDLLIHVASGYAAQHPQLDRPAGNESPEWFIDHNMLQGIVQACRDLRCQTRFLDDAAAASLKRQGDIPPAVVMLDRVLPLISQLVENGCTVVTPYFPVPPGLCSNVLTDWKEAFKEATQHLLNLGHRRIALLTVVNGSDVKVQMRNEGYAQAMRDRNCFDTGLIEDTTATQESIHAALLRLLQRRDRPTALLASNDLRARLAVKRLQEGGLRVPEDMAVAGFNDDPEAVRCTPPLTTCRPPHFECGYEAVKLLKRLVRHEVQGIQRIVIPCHLVIRESCGAKPARQ
jgi:DNA-binding LacI/PurR family transcriptional regulator